MKGPRNAAAEAARGLAGSDLRFGERGQRGEVWQGQIFWEETLLLASIIVGLSSMGTKMPSFSTNSSLTCFGSVPDAIRLKQ